MDRLTPEQAAMVEENLGLCGWAVTRWGRHLPDANGTGYTKADAYQDAVLGLARAVQRFDPSKGFRFATYAAPWLRNAIQHGQGQYGGREVRALMVGRTKTVTATPLSLDAPHGEAGGTLAMAIADPFDEDLATEHRLHLFELRRLRPVVCEDLLDEDIFDSLTTIDQDHPTTNLLELVGAANGVSREAARKRWRKIVGRLATHLRDEAA